MNAEGLLSAGGLSKKIVSYLILIAIDTFFSTYILFIDLSRNLPSDLNANAPFNMGAEVLLVHIFSGVQLFIHFTIIFWFFFLIWKTFMFRFGQLRKLAGFFPVLYLAPLNFLAFTFERALRYVSSLR